MTTAGKESPVPLDTEFDVALANQLAHLESYNKHLYRPNSYLHKWWARRCGSTFRLILKALAEDPQERDYYAAGGLKGKVILDPMIGGGTVLHEAIRLGANVIGADLDPIPVLQARATLSPCPLEKLEAAFDQLMVSLRRELRPLFATSCPECHQATEFRFVLCGTRRACRCGPALLVDSTVLRHESDGTRVRICPSCRTIARHQGRAAGHCTHCPPGQPRPPLVEKGNRKCSACGAPYQEDRQAPFYARYEPFAVAGRCPQHGLFFAAPTAADLALIERANSMRSTVEQALRSPVPPMQADRPGPDDFRIKSGPKSADLLGRGIASYLDLFSSRQLLVMQQAIRQLAAFEPLVRLNLALLVSTSLEFNSMLCGYKGVNKRRPGAVRHAFSHHAYSFPHTALENNPLYPARASGTLERLFHDRIRRARRWADRPVERVIKDGSPVTQPVDEVDSGVEVNRAEGLRQGERRFLLIQAPSQSLALESDSADAIVTDPPYFDSVQYSDLAAFFHVWLRRMLPDEANWDIDLAESAVNPRSGGGEQYTRVLGAIFSECHRVLRKPHGRLVFTFHHRHSRGWAALTRALKRAGFRLRSRYVVHSESPASVHIANLNSLTHDAILVLAPAEAVPAQGWQLPSTVDKSDSRRFCQDCSSALGWMLDAGLDGAEIEQQWTQLLA